VNDTVKIERPLCCRRSEDRGGRVKRDPMGNETRVRTRVYDAANDLSNSWLSLTATDDDAIRPAVVPSSAGKDC
jgi:hypothetical protein